jgi:hypothetical protein
METNPIKELQTNLAKDLVRFEESSLTDDQLKEIEKIYNDVYLKLHNIEKE